MRTILTPGLTVLAIIGIVAVTPLNAQEPSRQNAQDGNSPSTVGPGNASYKQKAQDGSSPATVGPGSIAYKQNTDGGSPPMVGPASKAYRGN
jgi:hypothetical protein